MKHVFLIAIALISINVTAQDRGRKQHKQGEDKIHFMKEMTPEEAATIQTKKMTLDLNLSEVQQTDIYNLNLEKIKERRAKGEERKKANDVDSKEKPSKEERYAFINQRLDNQIAHKKDMQRILEKDQFEKWEKQHKRQGAKRKHKRHRSKRSK